ncbi:MAG: hypothetical protein ACRCSN_08460 [Dermatophilaceae bacterium]
MSELEDELARLEASVVDSGRVARWLASVEALRQLLAVESRDLRPIILAMAAPRVEAAALAAVRDAYSIGANDAAGIIREIGRGEIGSTGSPSRDALGTVAGLDRRGREALTAAKTLARLQGVAIDDALAPLFGHANSIRASVSSGVTMGAAEGVTAVADAAGLPTVWVAETNACVHCLAYSGQVAAVGEPFPGGLTYGRKSYRPDPLPVPPQHPNCRCTVEPLRSADYAEALRREADRSVLRGFSLESESMATRIDAARRLIDRGVDAPQSVIDFAARSIRAGGFPTRGRPE